MKTRVWCALKTFQQKKSCRKHTRRYSIKNTENHLIHTFSRDFMHTFSGVFFGVYLVTFCGVFCAAQASACGAMGFLATARVPLALAHAAARWDISQTRRATSQRWKERGSSRMLETILSRRITAGFLTVSTSDTACCPPIAQCACYVHPISCAWATATLLCLLRTC